MSTYTGLQYNDTNTATLAGLKQKVYFDTKSNSASISDGDLNRIINIYYGRLQEAVRAVNENFYMYVATADLTYDGVGGFTFPDGTGTAPAYEKLKAIWVAYTPANTAAPLYSEYVRVNCIDPTEIFNPAYSYSNESPNAQMFGTYFVLNPLPLSTAPTITDGVKIYYIATQDTLTNDNDVPVIFPSFHDAIAIGAEADVHRRLGNDDEADKCEARFAKRLEEVKSYASDRLPQEIDMLEGQDDVNSWAFPWGFNSMS